MFFFGGTWWFCWPVVAIQWGVSRDLVTRNWTNPPDYMMVQFFGPEMKNNLIWEGIEFATQKILCEGCKLQKKWKHRGNSFELFVHYQLSEVRCISHGLSLVWVLLQEKIQGRRAVRSNKSHTTVQLQYFRCFFFPDQFPSNAHFSATFIRNGCA